MLYFNFQQAIYFREIFPKSPLLRGFTLFMFSLSLSSVLSITRDPPNWFQNDPYKSCSWRSEYVNAVFSLTGCDLLPGQNPGYPIHTPHNMKNYPYKSCSFYWEEQHLYTTLWPLSFRSPPNPGDQFTSPITWKMTPTKVVCPIQGNNICIWHCDLWASGHLRIRVTNFRKLIKSTSLDYESLGYKNRSPWMWSFCKPSWLHLFKTVFILRS